jgi:hypothetical protein
MAELLDLPSASTRFDFDFDPLFRLAALPFGVTPERARVVVEGANLFIEFGPWRVATTLDNVEEISLSGPYALPKVIGPAHVSLKDRGLTFATNARQGLCLRFVEPVKGIDPMGIIRHPGLTLTVDQPEAVLAFFDHAIEHRDDLVRDENDALIGMTAKELRALAAEHHIARAASMKKDELVEALHAVADQ